MTLHDKSKIFQNISCKSRHKIPLCSFKLVFIEKVKVNERWDGWEGSNWCRKSKITFIRPIVNNHVFLSIADMKCFK